MEKLLKLLNEYKPTNDVEDKEYLFKNGSIWIKYFTFGGETEYVNINTLILSKKFGFIFWLVKTNKIDKDRADNILYETEIFDYTHTDFTDRLLMYLAIQDDPIEFLVSLFK